MKQAFLNRSVDFITKYQPGFLPNDIDKLKYGLEGLYLTITKLVIISLLAILFGIFSETVLILLLFNVIRFPAFGFHAGKSSVCLFLSTLLFLGFPFLAKSVEISISIQIIIATICLLFFIIYAPADTEKRPLTNAHKRKLRKLAAIVVALIYIGCSLLIDNTTIANAFLSALIIETIMILPITYKIFKQPYANYKKKPIRSV